MWSVDTKLRRKPLKAASLASSRGVMRAGRYVLRPVKTCPACRLHGWGTERTVPRNARTMTEFGNHFERIHVRNRS